MRAVLVTAVLGVGTALVFAAAAMTATLFPNGTVVSGGIWSNRGWDVAVPMPAPVVREDVLVPADPTLVDPGFVVGDGFQALPGDTTGGDAGGVEDVSPEPSR
jgi:hypothetical protein